jgi:hypothetical protein
MGFPLYIDELYNLKTLKLKHIFVPEENLEYEEYEFPRFEWSGLFIHNVELIELQEEVIGDYGFSCGLIQIFERYEGCKFGRITLKLDQVTFQDFTSEEVGKDPNDWRFPISYELDNGFFIQISYHKNDDEIKMKYIFKKN